MLTLTPETSGPSHAGITVVVPAYNAEKFLTAALESVAEQTVQPAEIIVADDGSTDGTATVVEQFASLRGACRVRLLREPHRGPGAARNAAVRAARTEWVAFLDSDDRWEPRKLEAIMAAQADHPEVNIICHNELMHLPDGATMLLDTASPYRPAMSLPRQLFRRNLFSTSAVVCRRDVVLEVGGFDESLSSSQDYELWLKLSPRARPLFLHEPLGHYVVRAGNISTSHYWRRLANVLRVKHRYRRYVGAPTYVASMLYVTMMHAASPLRNVIAQHLRRRRSQS